MTTPVWDRWRGLFGWSLVRVDGNSMAPALNDGDYVLARRDRNSVEPNAVVVIRHPSLGRMVKRVRARDADGRYLVAGDNALSIRSDAIGALDGDTITGRVRWRVSPDGLQRIRDGARD